MNVYTESDVSSLISTLDAFSIWADDQLNYCVEDKRNDVSLWFQEKDIENLLLKAQTLCGVIGIGNFEPYYNEFAHFILEVQLEDVPLYINTYPVIAKWRLSRGI